MARVTGGGPPAPRGESPLVVLLLGALFGLLLVKSEAVSWFRIQEMFRFQSFHMFGILGSAVLVAGVSLALLRRRGARTALGGELELEPKEWGRGISQAVGGTIFGAGWALTGACPGPLYALIGGGVTVLIVALLAALAGAWVYGLLKPRLPH